MINSQGVAASKVPAAPTKTGQTSPVSFTQQPPPISMKRREFQRGHQWNERRGFGFSFQAWVGGSPEALALHHKSTHLAAPLSTSHQPPFPAPTPEEDWVEVEEAWKGSGNIHPSPAHTSALSWRQGGEVSGWGRGGLALSGMGLILPVWLDQAWEWVLTTEWGLFLELATTGKI